MDQELLNRIRVCLAGRAAEEVFFGDVTTGAANDLEKANGIANAMVCNYALVEELGLSTFDNKNPMTLLKIQSTSSNRILNVGNRRILMNTPIVNISTETGLRKIEFKVLYNAV